MHHALHVEEILLHIFSYCYIRKRPSAAHPWSPTGKRYLYANAHLTALARTCKMFKEPALDMIWAELDDLTPLVRCLPNTLWIESGGVYSLQRPLEQHEWDVILGYAHRVHTLRFLCGSLGLAENFIKAFSNPPTQPIFPDLRAVVLCEPSATIAPFVRQLASPKLTNICFEHTKELDSVLEFFAGCSDVTDLRVFPVARADVISGLIRSWQNLRIVKCRSVGLSVDALLHLSSLHNLVHVSFKVYAAVADQLCANQSVATALTFSALHDLHLTSDSLTPAWRLLRYLFVPEVRNLSVALRVGPTASDLMAFFTALQDACTPNSLNELSLRSCDVYDDISNSRPEPSPYHLTFERLRPLTVFMNIKSIRLYIPCGAGLNEHELLSLVSSWPHLETFDVGEDYHDWKEGSAITPGGFVQLLERCRSLRVFYFPFDTSGYTEIPNGHPWRGLTMPQGAHIGLLHSRIEEESVAALSVFFHVAPYPDFSLTMRWSYRLLAGYQRPRELHDLYYDRWEEVRTLSRDLWKERRDLIRSLTDQSSQ